MKKTISIIIILIFLISSLSGCLEPEHEEDELIDITCYRCDEGEVYSITFSTTNGNCPVNWLSYPPDDCGINPVEHGGEISGTLQSYEDYILVQFTAKNTGSINELCLVEAKKDETCKNSIGLGILSPGEEKSGSLELFKDYCNLEYGNTYTITLKLTYIANDIIYTTSKILTTVYDYDDTFTLSIITTPPTCSVCLTHLNEWIECKLEENPIFIVKKGSYQYTVSANGYKTKILPVYITGDTTENVVLELIEIPSVTIWSVGSNAMIDFGSSYNSWSIRFANDGIEDAQEFEIRVIVHGVSVSKFVTLQPGEEKEVNIPIPWSKQWMFDNSTSIPANKWHNGNVHIYCEDTAPIASREFGFYIKPPEPEGTGIGDDHKRLKPFNADVKRDGIIHWDSLYDFTATLRNHFNNWKDNPYDIETHCCRHMVAEVEEYLETVWNVDVFVGTGKNKETNKGHAWNYIRFNGEWVPFEATRLTFQNPFEYWNTNHTDYRYLPTNLYHSNHIYGHRYLAYTPTDIVLPWKFFIVKDEEPSLGYYPGYYRYFNIKYMDDCLYIDGTPTNWP